MYADAPVAHRRSNLPWAVPYHCIHQFRCGVQLNNAVTAYQAFVVGTTRVFRLREVVSEDERDKKQSKTYNIPLPHNSVG
jgi:hypothetical protein